METLTIERRIESSKHIIATLGEWTEHMPPDAMRLKIYNEAINDAIDFVQTLADKNPQHRLSLLSLIAEMREWLPLALDS